MSGLLITGDNISITLQSSDFFLSTSCKAAIVLGVATRKNFLAFRVSPELRKQIHEIADGEARSVSQICEIFLSEGVDLYKKEGAKLIQRLIAKQKNTAK
jgi:hypothetical protein